MTIPSHLPTTTATTRQGTIEECTVFVQITTIPHFTVHFRRPETPPAMSLDRESGKKYYDGSYGFDWLRDEYVYDLTEVFELPRIGTKPQAKRLYIGNINNLLKEYTRLNAHDAMLPEVKNIKNKLGETYIPAWLSIFPADHSSGINSEGVDLYLQVEQEKLLNAAPNSCDAQFSTLSNPENIEINFEADDGVIVSTEIKTLADLIAVAKPDLKLVYSGSELKSKVVRRHLDTNKSINIKTSTASSDVRFVKVKALMHRKHGVLSRVVGLLCIYPNAAIKKADIKVVHCLTHRQLQANGATEYKVEELEQRVEYAPGKYGTTTKTEVTRPDKWANSAPNEAEILSVLKQQSFNQALIETKITTDYVRFQDKVASPRIQQFLSDYQQVVPFTQLTTFMHRLADIYYEVFLGQQDIESDANKTTYLFLTDHSMYASSLSDPIGGAGSTTHDNCSGSHCSTVFEGGNFAIIFKTKHNDTPSIVHELGHSFSLPHSFIDKGYNFTGVHFFYRGYTDNIMDYGQKIQSVSAPPLASPDSLVNRLNRNATFKWQWKIMRTDNTVVNQK